MVDNLRFFAGAARNLEGKAAGEYLEGYTSWTRREAVGVIGQIAPWNYPLMMAIWKIGPALATGNTIVLKPAPTTPLTTLRLGEIAAEFLPKGVLNVVAGGNETGAALVTHDDVDMVSLTGSVETGKWIARAAADSLKRVHLELGGKAPVVVFDDADMEAMAETIAGTGWYNAGQDCTAATRVLAGSKVYDDVLQGLADQAARVQDRRHDGPGDQPRPAQLRASSASASRASSSARPTTREIVTGRQGARPARLLPRADRRRRPAPGRRDGPARDLRPGDHGPAVHATRPRRSRGPTARPTASRRRSGRATSAARCA